MDEEAHDEVEKQEEEEEEGQDYATIIAKLKKKEGRVKTEFAYDWKQGYVR